MAGSKDVKKDEDSKERKEARMSAKLPPCASCQSLVKSFEAGMQRTVRGKFEGGDTAWEEKNQVYYWPENLAILINQICVFTIL